MHLQIQFTNMYTYHTHTHDKHISTHNPYTCMNTYTHEYLKPQRVLDLYTHSDLHNIHHILPVL